MASEIGRDGTVPLYYFDLRKDESVSDVRIHPPTYTHTHTPTHTPTHTLAHSSMLIQVSTIC